VMYNKKTLIQKCPIFYNSLSVTKFDGYSFIFIHHLTQSNAPFLAAWIKKVKTIGVISIPYSEVMMVKKKLGRLVKVFSPKSVDQIPKLLLELSQRSPKEKIVLVEVGGYSSLVSDKLKNVVFGIEDTSQGHWLQVKNHNLRYPVVSIADTKAKRIEDRYVGESIVRTIDHVLKKHNSVFGNKEKIYSVLSYGRIGESVCLALRDRGVRPYVFDTNIFKRALAIADGYLSSERSRLLRISDVIIGCSGRRSITKNDIGLLKPGSCLFSGSSKQVEFEEILNYMDRDSGDNQLKVLDFGNKKSWIGYFGQPINFLDTTDSEMFDVPFALQVECFNYWKSSKLANKVYTLPMVYQRKILDLYVKFNNHKQL